MKKLLLLCLAAGCLSLAACSSDSSGGGGTTTPPKTCDQDPWMCPEGQTCWATSMTGDYKCLNSDNTKQKGDPCDNYINKATCPDDMSCYAVGSASGKCEPFCSTSDAAHKCETGMCMSLQLQGGKEVIQVCSPPKPPADAGPDTAAPDAEPDAAEPDAESEASTDAAEEAAEEAAAPDASEDDAAGE